MPFPGDLLYRDFPIFEGRGVAGVYDAGAVEAVLAVLSLPGLFADGLDEPPDDGEVSFAGFYLGGDHSRHACHVGVDAEGIARAVVPDLHLRAPVGAVEGDAEVVARRAVDGPSGLQVERRPPGEADEGRRQVLDLVGFVTRRRALALPAAPAAGAKLSVGGAAHAFDPWIPHQVEGHVDHVHAEVYERAAPRELFAGEPPTHARDAVAAHPGSLGVVDPTEVPLLHVPLERLHVAPLTLGKCYMDRAIGLSCRVYYLLGLGAVSREGFLAEHVPATFEGGNGDRRVQVVRRTYAHD